jgi:hypothetical protein
MANLFDWWLRLRSSILWRKVGDKMVDNGIAAIHGGLFDAAIEQQNLRRKVTKLYNRKSPQTMSV